MMYHIVPGIGSSNYIVVHWGFPRCCEVGFIQRSYIISTIVRSGLPDGLVY